ncbi:MAG: hypothetical protein QF704_11335 [Anaerolineales bacterium]|jgi:hypothetical protein|nr:hypothetical protein [Anaerolineales bacterium]
MTNLTEELVLDILQNHLGFDNRISSRELLTTLNMYEHISNRHMRLAIENLRQNHPIGARICSTTRQRGGYFLAEDQQELTDYLETESNRCIQMWQRIRKQRMNANLPSKDGVSIRQMELII